MTADAADLAIFPDQCPFVVTVAKDMSRFGLWCHANDLPGANIDALATPCTLVTIDDCQTIGSDLNRIKWTNSFTRTHTYTATRTKLRPVSNPLCGDTVCQAEIMIFVDSGLVVTLTDDHGDLRFAGLRLDTEDIRKFEDQIGTTRWALV